MPDETKNNLEPIEEGDLNLKEKFIGGAEIKSEEPKSEKNIGVESMENIPTAEISPERKEGRAEKEEAYNKILSKVSSATPAIDSEVEADAGIVGKQEDEENKINALVNMAETKGVAHAVKVARHYEDNYLLDEFHDRLLADELHNALVQKGLIKEI
ncbi:MAG TPA: hypothetical protein PLK35_02955 [Candidatus Moranbacteria bacterium]|nr:hypothetical protein [Candidatus Moranbacteria bacterium]